VTRLVHFEILGSPDAAIAREKQIKAWRRSKKLALISAMNPNWEDLSEAWVATPKQQVSHAALRLASAEGRRS
jgi:hypothetical protein